MTTSSHVSRVPWRRSSTTLPRSSRYASDVVGATRGLVLGKKSGLDSIRIKLDELGLDFPAERHAELLDAVKNSGTKKRGLVTDVEFRRLVNRKRGRSSID